MRLRTLASIALALLACAPPRATTPPPTGTRAMANGEATARVDPPSTRDAVTYGRDASWPTPISRDTTIDVGNGQSLFVSKNGRVALDDVVLQPIDDGVAHDYHLILHGDEATLTLGRGDAKGVNALRVMKIDLAHQRLSWHAVMGANLGFDNEPVRWRMVEGHNRLMLVEDERVIAMDSRTGTEAWSFYLLTPDFRREFTRTISPTLTQFHIEDAGVRGRELVLAVRLGEDRESTMVELDADSGRRVHVQSRRDAPVQTRLEEFVEPVVTDPVAYDDDPPPPPPPVPLRVDGYDGLAVGTTLLVWDVRTGRGLIVNPMHDALGEVLARAQDLRVRDAAGKPKEIEWAAVLDTKAIADAIVEKGAKFPLARTPALAHFDYGLVATDSIDFVDAPALARTLDIPAITSHTGLPKDITIRFEREPDAYYTSIRVLWGPFAFEDTNRPKQHATEVIVL